MIYKSKMYALFCVVLIVGIAFSLMLVFSACGSDPTADSVSEMFESRWKFSLPDDMELEYYNYERIWSGDGTSYAVFKTNTVSTSFIAGFSTKKNETFVATVNELTKNVDFEIGTDLLPDWESNYYWKHLRENIVDLSEEPLRYFKNIYLIYFQDISRLIICECLI